MKRMLSFLKDNDAVEKIIGGIFGAIAIIAIVIEMALDGFDSAAIVGGIKDIAGTAITIVMLIVAVNALRPKEETLTGFKAVFDNEMKIILKKYSPILVYCGVEEGNSYAGMDRYNIANRLDGISTNDPGSNNKLFRIKEGVDEITFSVSETVFPDRREGVSARIANKLALNYPTLIADTVQIQKVGFSLKLSHPMNTEEDAKELAKVIDYALVLYIAEYKK